MLLRILLVVSLLATVSASHAAPIELPEFEAKRAQVTTALEHADDATKENLKLVKQRLDAIIELLRAPPPPTRKALEAEVAELAAALKALDTAPEPAPPKKATDDGLAELQAKLNDERSLVEALQAEARQNEARLAALPAAIAEQTSAAAEARSRLGAPEDEAQDLAELDIRLAELRGKNLQSELDALRDGRAVAADRLRLARRQLSRSEVALDAYQAELSAALATQRHTLVAAVEAAQAAVSTASSDVQVFVAERRLQATLSRLAASDLSANKMRIQTIAERQRDRLVAERDEVSSLRGQLERGGAEAPTAERLKSLYKRANLRHRELRSASEAKSLTIDSEHRTRRYEVADRIYGFDYEWDQAVKALKPNAPARAEIETLHDEVLESLRIELRSLEEIFARVETARSLLAERRDILEQLDRMVRTRIFWVQDAPGLFSGGLATVPDEAGQMAKIAKSVYNEGSAFLSGLWPAAVIMVLALFLWRRLLRAARLRDPRPSADLLRAIARGAIPLGLGAVWMLVDQAGVPKTLSRMLSVGFPTFLATATAWWVLMSLYGRSGLGPKRLGVDADVARRVRRAGQIVLAVGIAAWLPAQVFAQPVFGLHALPRILENIAAIVSIVAVGGLLRPGRSVLAETFRTIGGDRIARFARVLGTGFWASGVGLLLMDIAGYRYGARWIGSNLVVTVALLVPAWLLLPGLARRLTDRLEPDEDTLRRWLVVVYALGSAIAVAAIWSIDQRAIAGLDAVEMYRLSSGDGPETVISLLNIVQALFTVIITLVILRLVPAVLRLTVFPYVATDEGGRYAILTITRYGLFLIGALTALNAVRLDLGRLGWLMAAVGVGLGFGLQEIVANFVSGVIILLERPIKVGDFVTIGSVEGTITQINIRATTVMNLDRQELIVPNRDFITKEVTNWTRQDSVVRLAVHVGVAYGTDLDKVEAALLSVTTEHLEVLKAPAPSVQMLGHGDSSLDFRLLVFHADPKRASSLRSALNRAVNKALADAGIEIPFPQRDLHLRSSDVTLVRETPEKAAPEKAAPEKAAPEKKALKKKAPAEG